MTPDNPLWWLAARLAQWMKDEGLLEHHKTMGAWTGDTLWRDEGVLPSGDRFNLWMVCEV